MLVFINSAVTKVASLVSAHPKTFLTVLLVSLAGNVLALL